MALQPSKYYELKHWGRHLSADRHALKEGGSFGALTIERYLDDFKRRKDNHLETLCRLNRLPLKYYNYVISKSQTACCQYCQWNLITSNSEGPGPPETIFHFIMFCPLFVNLRSTLLRNINYLLDSHHGQIINTIVDKTNVHYISNCISSNGFMAASPISRMTIILGKHLSDLVLEKSIDSIAKRFIRKA